MARTSSEARKKLFRAIVIAGASIGAAGCPEHGKGGGPDARLAVDAPKPGPPDAPRLVDAEMADVILIL